jgi:hypothetical protein
VDAIRYLLTFRDAVDERIRSPDRGRDAGVRARFDHRYRRDDTSQDQIPEAALAWPDYPGSCSSPPSLAPINWGVMRNFVSARGSFRRTSTDVLEMNPRARQFHDARFAGLMITSGSPIRPGNVARSASALACSASDSACSRGLQLPCKFQYGGRET